jgi:cell division transport system permease protein
MKAIAVRAHALRALARLLRRQPGSFLLGVLLAASALTLPLAGVSIARSLTPLIEQLPLGPEVSVFLAPGTSTTEIRQLQARLSARAGVQRVEWIARDAALKSLAQRTGNSALAELKSNPLPDVLVVTLAAESAAEAIDGATAELRALPRVETVVADTGWHRKLASLRRVAAAIAIAGGGLAAALLVLAVFASVQLQLSASRCEIRVLRLVGAEPGFIVRPYAYVGALTLLCGSGLAVALTGAGFRLLTPRLAELAGLYGLALDLRLPPAEWLAGAGLVAAAIGALIASLAFRPALRTRL